jgi:hypothetical protein
MTRTMVCGGGKECELVCPFMRKGHECPDVRDVERELTLGGVSLWDVLRAVRFAH